MNHLSARGRDEHSENPLVSVIIPAHNAASTLDLCLEAVAASDYRDYEVIVVCDGCVDRSAEIAEAQGARVIECESRHGAAYGRNVGAVAARGKIFFFVDADCILNSDALSIAVRTIGSGDEVIFGSYIEETRAPGFFSRFKNYQHHFTHQNADAVQISFWSGCGAITRKAFEDLNGFDVNIRGIEDIEFGYALTRRGYKVKLVKNMRVEHLKRYSLPSLIKSDLFDRAVPWTRLVASGRSQLGKLNTARKGVLSVLLTGLTLGVAPFAPWASVVCFAVLCTVSAAFLQFVMKRRGIMFAAASSLALFLHFIICGVGFVLGYLASRYPSERTPAPQYPWTESTTEAAEAEDRQAVAIKGP